MTELGSQLFGTVKRGIQAHALTLFPKFFYGCVLRCLYRARGNRPIRKIYLRHFPSGNLPLNFFNCAADVLFSGCADPRAKDCDDSVLRGL